MTQPQIQRKIKQLVGRDDFPLFMDANSEGDMTAISYESNWRSGGTEPVVQDGRIVFKQSYKNESLTKKQVSELDEFIKSILT